MGGAIHNHGNAAGTKKPTTKQKNTSASKINHGVANGFM
jgi:hypothetical protein